MRDRLSQDVRDATIGRQTALQPQATAARSHRLLRAYLPICRCRPSHAQGMPRPPPHPGPYGGLPMTAAQPAAKALHTMPRTTTHGDGIQGLASRGTGRPGPQSCTLPA